MAPDLPLHVVDAVAGALFAACLGIYVASAFPSVAGGDSGELITAAALLGVAHPPGYPLWTALTAAFIRLTAWTRWETAYRANLLSCLFGALASLALFRGLAVWFAEADRASGRVTVANRVGSVSAGCALLGAGLFSFSPQVWHSSTHAEVFSLNNVLCSSVVLLLSLSSPCRGQRHVIWMHVGAFVCGLCLSNQHTSVLVVAPAIGCVAVREPWKVFTRTPTLSLAFVLGLAPYVYLPMAAKANPHASWGGRSCETWGGFLQHVTRRDYGTWQLAGGDKGKGLTSYFNRVWMLLQDFASETLGAGPAAVVGGSCWSLSPGSGRAVGRVLVFSLLAHVTVFLALANVEVEDVLSRYVLRRFWSQAYIAAYALGAAALREALLQAGEQLQTRKWSDFVPNVIIDHLGALCLVAGAGACALCGRLRFEPMDESSNLVVAHFAQSVLSSMPKGGVLLTQGDTPMYATRYVRDVQGLRKDVTLVEVDMLQGEWFWRDVLAWRVAQSGGISAHLLNGTRTPAALIVGALKAKRGKHQGHVLAVPDLKGEHLGVSGLVEARQSGLMKQLVLKGTPLEDDVSSSSEEHLLVVKGTDLAGYLAKEGWERAVLSYHWHAQLSRGFATMRAATALLDNQTADPQQKRKGIMLLLLAIERFEGVRRRFGGHVFNCDLPRNIGLSYAQLSHLVLQQSSSSGDAVIPGSELLKGLEYERLWRAAAAALSVYVNCDGAQAAIVVAANSFLQGNITNIRVRFD